MTTLSQDQLLELAILALLITAGVAGFFIVLIGLLATMTLALVVGVSPTTNSDMRDAQITDRAN